MEKETIKPYNKEEALKEAAKMKEKIESGDAKDYDEAEKRVEEETAKEIETNHSIFNERTLMRGCTDLIVDEKEKILLMDKIKLLASQAEKSLELKEDEELKWDIDFIPPLNGEELQFLRERAEKNSGDWIQEFLWELEEEELDDEEVEGKKIFGLEFINDLKELSEKEKKERLKPKVIEYLMKTNMSEWDSVLRANITVYLIPKGMPESKLHFASIGHKGEEKTKSNYSNINLFGNKIIQKNKGEITIEDLANDIVAELEKREK